MIKLFKFLQLIFTILDDFLIQLFLPVKIILTLPNKLLRCEIFVVDHSFLKVLNIIIPRLNILL